MVKIWLYFHKSLWVVIFVCFSNFFSQKHIFRNFKWAILPLDFVSFLFRTFKLKNDTSYIKCKFSHNFGRVCRWLNMYYSNIKIMIFFKVTSMSSWIILKNLLWIYMECNFYHYWAIVPCIHPTLNVANSVACLTMALITKFQLLKKDMVPRGNPTLPHVLCQMMGKWIHLGELLFLHLEITTWPWWKSPLQNPSNP